MVQFRTRVCFVVRDDEASHRIEWGRHHEGRLRVMLRGNRHIRVRAGLWDSRGRAEGGIQLGTMRGGKLVDLRVLECAVLYRVAASRPGKARCVFYICSTSA